MFALDMLPAEHGDCLWIEYGPGPAPRRVLIDGGTPGTFRALRPRLAALPPAQRRFELLVVSHIDADHIGGVIELLEDESLGVTFGDVWFNGFRHLPADAGTRGAAQGERLTDLLRARRLPWNAAFHGDAVVVPAEGALPRVMLDGGLALTLLSPHRAGLERLRGAWEKECAAAGIAPGARPRAVDAPTKREARPRRKPGAAPDLEKLLDVPFAQDGAEANGSSIALLAEHDGKRCLLTGDAYPGVLMESFERLFAERGGAPVRLDAMKVSHHGSRGNTTWPLLYRFECGRYLFSTDGSVFDHPDDECVARVIAHGGPDAQLFFNYRCARTEAWSDPARARALGYTARYPAAEGAGLRVEL
jgi:hypothetical protein